MLYDFSTVFVGEHFTPHIMKLQLRVKDYEPYNVYQHLAVEYSDSLLVVRSLYPGELVPQNSIYFRGVSEIYGFLSERMVNWNYTAILNGTWVSPVGGIVVRNCNVHQIKEFSLDVLFNIEEGNYNG